MEELEYGARIYVRNDDDTWSDNTVCQLFAQVCEFIVQFKSQLPVPVFADDDAVILSL